MHIRSIMHYRKTPEARRYRDALEAYKAALAAAHESARACPSRTPSREAREAAIVATDAAASAAEVYAKQLPDGHPDLSAVLCEARYLRGMVACYEVAA
jgi:hypothetical protein